jgi:hypothetical protein
MTTFAQPWLSEDEVLFHRMEVFHRQRVNAIASGQSPLGEREDGVLVVHFISRSCVHTRTRFDGAKLKEHGSKVSSFGERGAYPLPRFNVDGILNLDGESYSQIYRDGRMESAMSAIVFQPNGQFAEPDQKSSNQPRYLRDTICEQAVFKLTKNYLSFCTDIGLHPPITMYSALVGCKGVLFHSDWGHRYSRGGIDRMPAFLPDIEFAALDADPVKLLRSWCDTLSQACGLEKSPNFDESGNWRERR